MNNLPTPTPHHATQHSTPNPYADIIHLPHPVIHNHPPLSIAQRAAQFAPFKTITAYHDSTDDIEANSHSREPEIIWEDDYLASLEDSSLE